jgi:hypothetical protein
MLVMYLVDNVLISRSEVQDDTSALTKERSFLQISL